MFGAFPFSRLLRWPPCGILYWFFFFFLTASPWATVSFPSCEWFCKNLRRGGKNEKHISTEGNLKASLMNRRRTLTRFLAVQISLSLPIHSDRRRCAMKTSVVAVSSGVFQSGTPAWAAMEPKRNRWRFAMRSFTKHQNTLKENCIVPSKTVSVVSRLHPSCLQVPLWPCMNQTQTQDQLLFVFIFFFFELGAVWSICCVPTDQYQTNWTSGSSLHGSGLSPSCEKNCAFFLLRDQYPASIHQTEAISGWTFTWIQTETHIVRLPNNFPENSFC